VLPFTVGIRDSAVQLVSTLGMSSYQHEQAGGRWVGSSLRETHQVREPRQPAQPLDALDFVVAQLEALQLLEVAHALELLDLVGGRPREPP
jgi:hypothetical protein